MSKLKFVGTTVDITEEDGKAYLTFLLRDESTGKIRILEEGTLLQHIGENIESYINSDIFAELDEDHLEYFGTADRLEITAVYPIGYSNNGTLSEVRVIICEEVTGEDIVLTEECLAEIYKDIVCI